MDLTAGLRLGRIAGIEITLAWSLTIVFALVAGSLALAVFPSWHPHWSTDLCWALAGVAALLFIASILAHELAHALVGRYVDVPVREITLFVFGGMARLERDPPTWRAEFAVAAAGPAASFVLGLLCLYLAFASDGALFDASARPVRTLADLGPAASLLLWLGTINLLLAVFNLLPAFPLDGGRMLRAVLWGASDDLMRATRWAAGAGQGFAWLLFAVGLAMLFGLQLPLLGGGPFAALWLMLIGWFLQRLAVASVGQLQLRLSLQQVSVARLMRTDLIRLDPQLQWIKALEPILLAGEQRAFPVERHGRFLGLLCPHELAVGMERPAASAVVAQVMTPSAALPVLNPQQQAFDALRQMNGLKLQQLPVLDGERLVGLLQRDDVQRWLQQQLRRAA